MKRVRDIVRGFAGMSAWQLGRVKLELDKDEVERLIICNGDVEGIAAAIVREFPVNVVK